MVNLSEKFINIVLLPLISWGVILFLLLFFVAIIVILAPIAFTMDLIDLILSKNE